ncbi:DUF6415 family natural product biosynthesis protein [Streptomyces lydicus]|uniref:DUF6415 family natural product biosynthesis protein n=1 Tax=Streptomyces lydicus TaxID=47763 RepID=UPI0036E9C744
MDDKMARRGSYNDDRMHAIVKAGEDLIATTPFPPPRELEQYIRLLDRCLHILCSSAEERWGTLRKHSPEQLAFRRAIDYSRSAQAAGPGTGFVSATAYARGLWWAMKTLVDLAQ